MTPTLHICFSRTQHRRGRHQKGERGGEEDWWQCGHLCRQDTESLLRREELKYVCDLVNDRAVITPLFAGIGIGGERTAIRAGIGIAGSRSGIGASFRGEFGSNGGFGSTNGIGSTAGYGSKFQYFSSFLPVLYPIAMEIGSRTGFGSTDGIRSSTGFRSTYGIGSILSGVGIGIGIEKCQKIALIPNPDSDPAVEL